MWIYIIVYIYIYIIVYVYIYIYPTSHGIPCCSRTVSAFGLKLHLRLRKARQTVAHPPLFGGGRFGALASNDLLRKHDMGMLYIWIYIYIWILIHGIPSRKMWDVVLFWKIHGIYTRTNGFCKKKLGKTVGNLRTYRNFRVSNGEQMLLNNNWELRPTRNFRDVWRFHQHWLIHIHPSSTIVYSVAEKTLVSHVMNVYMCNVYKKN